MRKKLSWFKKRKLQKQLELEMVETMCTILLYLEEESRRTRPHRLPYEDYFRGHFDHLKKVSIGLRESEVEDVRN